MLGPVWYLPTISQSRVLAYLFPASCDLEEHSCFLMVKVLQSVCTVGRLTTHLEQGFHSSEAGPSQWWQVALVNYLARLEPTRHLHHEAVTFRFVISWHLIEEPKRPCYHLLLCATTHLP